MPPTDARKTWTPTDVVDVSGPAALLRNYREQHDIRHFLDHAAARGPIRRACDIGCGFGRLTPVLAERAKTVVGFEREPSLVAIAQALLPGITIVQLDTLSALPEPDASVDFALTFTVLQHMPDGDAERVIAEMRRVVAPQGSILIVEETDPTLEAGDPAHADLGYTRGRPVTWYAERLLPWVLNATRPRRIEPGYPRADVGTFMFFGRP
jgi:SAM-dependent methyltransferase